MLQIKKGSDCYRMSNSMWFALGVASATHAHFQRGQIVAVLHDYRRPEPDDGKGMVERVKLRTRHLSEGSARYWEQHLRARLPRDGFEVRRELSFLVISFNESKAGRTYTVVE